MRAIASGLLAAALMVAIPAVAQTAKPVKIGVLNDQSSSFAAIGGTQVVDAVKIAIQDFGGSVLGQPIEVVSADHQNKPDVALSVARQWLERDDVDVLVDVANSGIAVAVNNLLPQEKKIALFVSALADDMTEAACNGYGISWAYDAYSVARASALSQIQAGQDTWFIISPDYAGGIILESTMRDVIQSSGGKVLGTVRAPLGSTDFSSYILQAQASKAKVIALTLNGPDLVNAMKQIQEFGLVNQGQRVAITVAHDADVQSIGLDTLKGIQFAVPWYWDTTDASRAYEKKIEAMEGRSSGWIAAGAYSAVTNYLKAVQAAGSKDSDKVLAQLHSMKIDDFFARDATLFPNGRLIHDDYIVRIKSPQESKSKFDIYNVIGSVPAADAYRPLSATKCPLVTKK